MSPGHLVGSGFAVVHEAVRPRDYHDFLRCEYALLFFHVGGKAEGADADGSVADSGNVGDMEFGTSKNISF